MYNPLDDVNDLNLNYINVCIMVVILHYRFLLYCFETGSHRTTLALNSLIAEGDLALLIVQPLPLECYNCRCVSM